MATPAVEFQSVSKAFGSAKVLDRLDLTIAAGEKVALIGPSGSGKTTILRILMTLETIDSGMVRVEGEPLWEMVRDGRPVPADERHLHAMRRKLGMVFQQFNLFPHMNVLENVILAPVLSGALSRDEAAKRGALLLEMVGMADKATCHPAQLSGGQKQRVAIARALALRPRVMLFDEVTSALDPELVDEVLAVMHKLARETEMTMLLVTHEMSFARDFADRVIFFERGALVEQGPPSIMFTAPVEERTRAFLRKTIGTRLTA